MAIQETKQPYEFLARWRDGRLVGAHIQFITRVTDGDRVLVENISDAIPVGLSGGAGFPVADLLQQMQVDALSALSSKTAELAAMTAGRDAAQASLAAAQEARAALQAELDTLKGGVVDGVPQSVSRFQARAALLDAGLLDPIQKLMEGPDVPAVMKLAWNDAQTFERQSPTLLALAAQLHLSDADLDALFVAAAAFGPDFQPPGT